MENPLQRSDISDQDGVSCPFTVFKRKVSNDFYKKREKEKESAMLVLKSFKKHS